MRFTNEMHICRYLSIHILYFSKQLKYSQYITFVLGGWIHELNVMGEKLFSNVVSQL